MPTILQYVTIPIVGFVYFLAVLLIFRRQISQYPPSVYKLFKYGLVLKLVSAVFVELIYLHYYGYGDTLVYHREATFFLDKLVSNPLEFYNLFSLTPSQYKIEFAEIISQTSGVFDYYNESTIRIIKVTSFLSIFSFNSIFGTGMIYGCLCYIGLWYIYRVISYHMPDVKQSILFSAIVFMPSVMFWGSGILKEPLAVYLLGIILYHIHKLIILRRFNLLSVIILFIAHPFLYATKSYYLLVLYPSFFIFAMFFYVSSIRSNIVRRLSKGTLVLASLILILLTPIILSITGLSDEIMSSTLEYVIRYNENLSKGSGSAYELNLSGTGIFALVKVAPQAIIVSLFRPFLWESNKIIILITAIESTFVVLLTIYFFFKVRLYKLIRLMLQRPILIFMIIFTLLFAIVTGISSGNFGALARYRVALIPFYISFLTCVLLYFKTQKNISENETKN